MFEVSRAIDLHGPSIEAPLYIEHEILLDNFLPVPLLQYQLLVLEINKRPLHQ